MGSGESKVDFSQTAIKRQFQPVPHQFSHMDLLSLIDRFKDMNLSFSLNREKLGRLLQLSFYGDELVNIWFDEFAADRSSRMVDGLEFMCGIIVLNARISVLQKCELLFKLFDLDGSGTFRKDVFTIFLKAFTTAVSRMVINVPKAQPILEIEKLSLRYFKLMNLREMEFKDVIRWITESHLSIRYLNLLSELGSNCVFGWGRNMRGQVGVATPVEYQPLPIPLLGLDKVSIAKIATNESHTMFLAISGKIYACGYNFAGILGLGGMMTGVIGQSGGYSGTISNPIIVHNPIIIESLASTRVCDIAVGVRHSICVTESGQVFTWGACDFGQLGHGKNYQYSECHDTRNGGVFRFLDKPTVVSSLAGKRLKAEFCQCCNYTSLVTMEDGHEVYAWGNDTEGQCGQGQKSSHHHLVYADPHISRSALQVIWDPVPVKNLSKVRQVVGGGYHFLAIDKEKRIWSWGQGLWGKLGHGDQRTMYTPKLVERLKYHAACDVAAGQHHSMALTSSYNIMVKGAAGTKESGKEFSSFRGLPLCCSDKISGSTKATNVIYINVPHVRQQDEQNLLPSTKYPAKEVGSSVVLMDRPLFEGEWLKLSTTDFDFNIKTIGEDSNIPIRNGLSGSILLLEKNDYERKDCEDKICVLYEAFEDIPIGREVTSGEIIARCTKQILATALEMQESGAIAVFLVLPEALAPDGFRRSDDLPELARFSFGIMEHEHGNHLREHCAKLLANSQDIIAAAKEWEEHHEPFTGIPFYQNKRTNEKRRFRPVFSPKVQCLLLDIKVDLFVPHLSNIVSGAAKPKGIIICQRSWRPDCEFVDLLGPEFQSLNLPLALLSYEDGEELKELASTRAKELHITIEEHKTGSIYGWGNGTQGQLGLHKILNVDPFEHSVNPLTGEANIYVPKPVYLSHLHGEGIVDLSCGYAHTIACTKRNEVFSWGAADGLGLQSRKRHEGSSVPVLIEQFENLVYVNQVYAGYNHSFAICDMPFRSVLGTGR